MLLTKENIAKITTSEDLTLPEKEHMELTEKVLEFGTGVLLRGLPNHFIDKANKAGIFNGRIVVVKSTDKGSTQAFTDQSGLYTLCVRGVHQGKVVDEKVVNASISRVVSACSEWQSILDCAHNPELSIIISNVTEIGLRLEASDRMELQPPASFPGKLLAFLYERYKAFGGSAESGMVLLPTELVPDNGKVLKKLVLDLAALHACEAPFVKWIQDANDFCSTLVDRIVPGALPQGEQAKVCQTLGYEDQLMIMAEPYSLWAIETQSARTQQILSFAAVDPSIVITDNINLYREIKLRLLNAPHTFACAFALLHSFKTVKQAMDNPEFRDFISELMYREIIPVLQEQGIPAQESRSFADRVLDRFSNPYIAHEWQSISMQYTSKLALRCVPLVQGYYKKFNAVPRCMAMGIAAYLLLMKTTAQANGCYEVRTPDLAYVLQDDKAEDLYEHWQHKEFTKVAYEVLKDAELWKQDLSQLPEFKKAVVDALQLLANKVDANKSKNSIL